MSDVFVGRKTLHVILYLPPQVTSADAVVKMFGILFTLPKTVLPNTNMSLKALK